MSTPEYYYSNTAKLYKSPNILVFSAQNGLFDLPIRLIPLQMERFSMPEYDTKEKIYIFAGKTICVATSKVLQ
jgi:hypothetical protein